MPAETMNQPPEDEIRGIGKLAGKQPYALLREDEEADD